MNDSAYSSSVDKRIGFAPIFCSYRGLMLKNLRADATSPYSMTTSCDRMSTLRSVSTKRWKTVAKKLALLILPLLIVKKLNGLSPTPTLSALH